MGTIAGRPGRLRYLPDRQALQDERASQGHQLVTTSTREFGAGRIVAGKQVRFKDWPCSSD
jgi:hypothetical protein